MRKDYALTYPSLVRFGVDAALKLSEYIPAARVNILMVTGRRFAESEGARGVLAALGGRRVTVVTGVRPEPTLADTDKLVERGRAIGADAVIAIGGGSVIDAAKAAAALIPLEGWTGDYFRGERRIPGKGLFFMALPTTAGTGAEITANSVLIDADTQIKKSLRHADMVPDVAIVDPRLTLSCPPDVTAWSGLDALTQAVESFLSLNANAVTRAAALAAVSLLSGHLRTVCREPENLAARAAVAEGSMLSAMAFSQSGLGAVHGLAHPIGASLSLAHGLTCAILLAPVLEWNRPVAENDYVQLAAACGGRAPDDFIEAIRSLSDDLRVPRDFVGFGLKKDRFPFIIENCRSASMSSNPRPLSDADIRALLDPLAGA